MTYFQQCPSFFFLDHLFSEHHGLGGEEDEVGYQDERAESHNCDEQVQDKALVKPAPGPACGHHGDIS